MVSYKGSRQHFIGCQSLDHADAIVVGAYEHSRTDDGNIHVAK
ncbi:hypothetical protein ABIE33_003653 [Ensifer sp. 4252]